MTAIPFPLSTSPGISRQESAGRLINVYAEPRGEGTGPVWHRAPGLKVLGSDQVAGTWVSWSFPFEEWFVVREQPTGQGSFRGGVLVNGTIYGTFGTSNYTVDDTGAFGTLTGTISGTDKVFWAHNNAATPDIVFVSNDGPFIISGGAKTSYPDGDVGSPNSVCFHDGYFMFTYGSGKLQASGINSTSINSLDFTTAESNPDGLLRAWSKGGQLFAAGPNTIEVYGQPINASAFPLTRVGYNITPGLITAGAVAGFEAEFGNPPIYVGSDNTVRQLDGFTPTKISPPELDTLISEVADKDTLEACCYISRGHAFWQLSCDDWTWVFNLNNSKWHERASYLNVRSRITGSIAAFSEWLVGDTDSGDMLQIDGALREEADSPLIARIESGAVKDFPNRVRVARADFDFVVGIGDATGEDPIEVDPKVEISWSDDGGVNWSTPWLRDLGKQDETQQRITVLNTGLSGPMGRRWRLDVSDPIQFGVMGGDMSAEVRAK